MFERIVWRWELFWARSRVVSYCEIGMAYTLGHQSACKDVYSLESHGITKGWIEERTVHLKDTEGQVR